MRRLDDDGEAFTWENRMSVGPKRPPTHVWPSGPGAVVSLTRWAAVLGVLTSCSEKAAPYAGAPQAVAKEGPCSSDSDCLPEFLCACPSDRCGIFPDFTIQEGQTDGTCFSPRHRLVTRQAVRADGGWIVEAFPGKWFSTREAAQIFVLESPAPWERQR